MGRGVIGLCALFGSVAGGYVPSVWGAGSLGLESLLLGAVGGVVGVLLGARLADG